jgi:TolB protein
MTSARKLAVLLFAVLCSLPSGARAQDTTATRGVRIGLTYAPGTRPGVLVLPVAGPNADSVKAILLRDLDYGDRVSVIPSDSGAPGGALNYPAYAAAGAAAVVQASVTPSGSLHIAVHDVAGARVMNALDFPLGAPALGPDWRLAVHRGADEIERVITGVRGIAATRAAFVRDGSVWIVDSDGAGVHAVPGTTGGLSPAWHPSGRYLGYDELANTGHQTIVVRDLVAGAVSRRITTQYTLNISPAFSPDGSTLVFAAGDDGSDLFSAKAFENSPPARLMASRGFSNASPSFSPDGKQIAFTSNRLGHAEVYIMDADGTNPDLLTTTAFGDQLYRSDPDWSPDGRRVAFQSQIGGVFQIMAINLRDRSVQSLTSEGRNDEPSWAPDGRHLLFTSTRTGTKQLWVLDTESGRTRQLTHGDAARMGAWSPHLDATR